VPLAVNPDTPALAVAVHAYVVPVTPEVSVTSPVALPEQIVFVNGELVTIGFGLTSTVAILFALIELEQYSGEVPLPRSVTVIVVVADKDIVVKVPVVPLKTIVAIFPGIPGFVV
jgi:hypothetical protein